MRHIIPISGKDSLATALVQLKRQPDLPYEYMFNPTGAELPEVFDWINKVELYLGKEIIRVGENLEDIIEDYNFFLPSGQARYCTRQSKIQPMEKWIGKDECTIYYGIRADEVRKGYVNPSGRITVVLPLDEENINIDGVYEIINHHGLKPPTFFWKQVYDKVCKIIGGESVLKSLLKDWQIDMIFAWRSRANCYFCYNQRQYEWCGLLEYHPDLFWNAESMEHKGGEKTYSWNSNRTLRWIYENKESIVDKRVKSIVKIIDKLKQGEMNFNNNEDGFNDVLSTASCGLFCGK